MGAGASKGSKSTALRPSDIDVETAAGESTQAHTQTEIQAQQAQEDLFAVVPFQPKEGEDASAKKEKKSALTIWQRKEANSKTAKSKASNATKQGSSDTEVLVLQRSKLQLTKVPAECAFYKNLEVLDLSWNDIKEIPRNMFPTWPALRTLDLSFNELTTLPEDIHLAWSLETIDMQSNQIHYLPSAMDELRALRELFLSENQFPQFPHELRNLKNLEVLDLGNNKMTRVGRTVATNKNLVSLSMSHNQIPSLPADIGRLHHLRTLELSNNQLVSLPPDIGRLTSLEYLDVRHNKLTVLPAEIMDCSNLQVLIFSDNELTEFPVEVGFIKTLRELHAADNKMALFKADITRWGVLEVLDLSGNLLPSLPAAIGWLPALEELNVMNMPTLRIPHSVLQVGARGVMAYLQTVGAQHEIIDNQMKAFIGMEFSTARRQTEEVQRVDEKEVHEIVTLQFQLANDSPGKLHSGERDVAHDAPSEGGAVVKAPSGVLAAFGGGGHVNKAHLKQEVEQLREWMNDDPRRKALQVVSRAEKQAAFREDVDAIRRKLEKAGQSYGNVTLQRIHRAKKTGLLALRGLGIQSLPPEIEALTEVHVADVSHNRLDRLNEYIMGLPSLVVLNAASNFIDHVVGDIQSTGLRVLNLAFNSLDNEDMHSLDGLTCLTNLQLLYLSANKITTLPTSFANMRLLDLYLGENEISEMPAAVVGMTTLQKLSMACNMLATLPPTIVNLSSIRFLDLSFNHIVDLPPAIAQLTQLERLNLGFNPLGPLMPANICKLTSLVELNMDFCDIVTVPPEIGCLQSLEALQMDGNPLEYPGSALYSKDPLLLVGFSDVDVLRLDLSDCGLHELPPAIMRLTNLTALDLRDNDLAMLPVELGLLTALESIALDGNPLSETYELLRKAPHGDIATVHFLNVNSTSLDLSGRGFVELPQQLMRHTDNLLELNLSKNRLKYLPYVFTELAALQVLVLDDNQLEQIPPCLCNMPSLKELYLNRNLIDEIPEEIRDLRSLTRLILDSNNLSELPDSLTELTNLEVLAMPNNNITALPSGLGNLARLSILDLQCNSLAELPHSIGRCTALEVLEVRINSLKGFPSELGNCTGLKVLSASNNNIYRIPQSCGRLKELRVLKLGANNLFELPYGLTELPEVEEVQLYGNEMPRVPVALTAKGHEAAAHLLGLLREYFPKTEEESKTAADVAQASMADLLSQTKSMKLSKVFKSEGAS